VGRKKEKLGKKFLKLGKERDKAKKRYLN